MELHWHKGGQLGCPSGAEVLAACGYCSRILSLELLAHYFQCPHSWQIFIFLEYAYHSDSHRPLVAKCDGQSMCYDVEKCCFS